MITFTVYGIPQTKGSAKAFMCKGMRFPVVTNDCKKEKPWAQTVSAMAQQARPSDAPWGGPIKVRLVFRMPAPKSLPKRRPTYMTKRPDIDKATRSALDALKGVFYFDDAQVVALDVSKVYGREPGAVITVEELDQNYEGAVVYAYRPAQEAPHAE